MLVSKFAFPPFFWRQKNMLKLKVKMVQVCWFFLQADFFCFCGFLDILDVLVSMKTWHKIVENIGLHF